MRIHRRKRNEADSAAVRDFAAPSWGMGRWRDALSDRAGLQRGARRNARRSGTLLRDQRGVAAVEFGLIAVVMFVMMAGAVDFSQRIIFQRDLKRFANSVALAMAACPSGGGTCSRDAINDLLPRTALLLPGVKTTELRLASFYLEDGKVVMGPGVTTYFQGTEGAAAKALLVNELDSGVFVSIKATHDPIFPSFAAKWGLVSKQFTEQTMQLSFRKV
jgi:Flp pilus assembly pilin Flp